MRRIHSILFSALFALGCSTTPAPQAAPRLATTRPAYPQAKTVDVVDDYHGTKVADPYRWLEDADSPDTKQFVDAQNALFQQFVAGDLRDRLKQRLTELLDYPRYTAPARHGPFYSFSKNDGLQNQSVLYISTSPDDRSP